MAFGLHLSQSKYVTTLLQKVALLDSKAPNTPMCFRGILAKDDDEILSSDQASQNRSVVRVLQYCVMTRPKLTFNVSKLCQYINCPIITHLQVVKRAFHYLKGPFQYGLMLSKLDKIDLFAYINADWDSCQDDRKSIWAYSIFFGRNFMSLDFIKIKESISLFNQNVSIVV